MHARHIAEGCLHGYMVHLQEQRFAEVDRWMEGSWPRLRAVMAQAGWQLERLALCSSLWRGAWGDALHMHEQ